MRDRAVVSERGTITIPEYIRNLAGIHPGDLIKFRPKRNRIILQHLVVKYPEEENLMSSSEWEKFDALVQKQVKKGQYASYNSLTKAKLHSRKLMRQKS